MELPPGTISLAIIFGWLIISTIVGIMAGVLKKFSLAEWMVAERGISFVILYFAVAAEIYSAFTFLGLAGWAVTHGASILYAPAYFVTAYCTGFLLTPYYHRLGKKFGYLTEPDFFIDRYESRALGILVALVGIFFLLPYIQLQILGTGIIVEAASYGAISRTPAILIAFLCTAVFVFIGGYRGIAWTNFLQGIIMFIAAFVAIGVVFAAFGGIEPLFRKVLEVSPKHLLLPGAKGIHGYPWYMSSLLLTTLGFWMFPHLVQRGYSARQEKDIMRTCAWMSWYSLLSIPIVFVGFAAIILFPGVTGYKLPAADYAVIESVKYFFNPWIVGLVGAGGLAAAISTGAGLIQCESGLAARNLIQRGIWPKASETATAWAARALSLIFTVICLFLALYYPQLLVYLLLVAYSGVVQFFPGWVLGITWRRVTKAGVFAGIVVGVIVVLLTTFVWPDPLQVHSGIWGLFANFLVTIPVSLATKPPSEETIRRILSA